jgi:hypothetical protein
MILDFFSGFRGKFAADLIFRSRGSQHDAVPRNEDFTGAVTRGGVSAGSPAGLVGDGGAYAGAEELGELGGVEGATEEVALAFGALLGLKVCSLFLRFDALGNYQVFEASSHANDGSYNQGVVVACGDLMDEGAVYLQYINGKLTKVAEAGVAGSKVIHGKAYAHFF